MRYCWVPNCKNTDEKKKDVSFHVFPKNAIQRQLWITAIGCCKEPTKTSLICSNHFRKDDFDFTTKITRLKPDAVPSRFEPKLRNAQDHGPNNAEILSEQLNDDDIECTVKRMQLQTLQNSPIYEKSLEILQQPGNQLATASQQLNTDNIECTVKSIQLQTYQNSPTYDRAPEILQKSGHQLATVSQQLNADNSECTVKSIQLQTYQNSSAYDRAPATPQNPGQQVAGVSQKKKKILFNPKHLSQIRPEHLQSPQKRQHYWSEAMKEITLLRKKVKVLHEKNRRLSKRLDNEAYKMEKYLWSENSENNVSLKK